MTSVKGASSGNGAHHKKQSIESSEEKNARQVPEKYKNDHQSPV